MLTIPVKDLYLLDSVQKNPIAMARAKRLAQGLGVAHPTVVSRRELEELSASWEEKLPSPFPRRTGSFNYNEGWTIVLDTLRDNKLFEPDYRDAGRQMEVNGFCRSALELHCAFGCSHRCQYCHVSPVFQIACDLEYLAEKIPQYCAEYPTQKLYKFDNWTDTIALEPEYGASALMVPLFAELEDRFLLLYTKSDNVDHLLDLHHGGHTIVNWSLSPLTQSRQIEINAPDTMARIEAMRKCAAAGYTVRCRISPITPLKGWRKELREMLDALYSTVTPDVVTVDVIGWSQPEALIDAMDISQFEAPFRDALRALVGTGNRLARKYLFPHELRASVLHYAVTEMKRRAPDVPVALCNETLRMWTDLSDDLIMTPQNFACCCGPDSVPGHPLLSMSSVSAQQPVRAAKPPASRHTTRR